MYLMSSTNNDILKHHQEDICDVQPDKSTNLIKPDKSSNYNMQDGEYTYNVVSGEKSKDINVKGDQFAAIVTHLTNHMIVNNNFSRFACSQRLIINSQLV